MQAMSPTPEMLAKAFLRSVSKKHRESGFVFPDGEWIPLGEWTHEETVRRLLRMVEIPGESSGTYTLAHHFNAIHVTAMGHLGIDANVDHITAKQLETLATRIIESVQPDSMANALFNMHYHPKSEIYHARLQKLVGNQYRVGFVS